MGCWRPAQIGPHQATNEAVAWLPEATKQLVVGLILYTNPTTHKGPYIEQCTHGDVARHDMELRWGAGGRPKLDLIEEKCALSMEQRRSRNYAAMKDVWERRIATIQHLLLVQINLSSTSFPPIVIMQVDRVGITVRFHPVKIAIANCLLGPLSW